MQRLFQSNVESLFLYNFIVSVFGIVFYGFLQDILGAPCIRDNLDRIVVAVLGGSFVFGDEAKGIDRRGRTTHGDFTIFGAQQSIDYSCLTDRNIAEDSHANLKLFHGTDDSLLK